MWSRVCRAEKKKRMVEEKNTHKQIGMALVALMNEKKYI